MAARTVECGDADVPAHVAVSYPACVDLRKLPVWRARVEFLIQLVWQLSHQFWLCFTSFPLVPTFLMTFSGFLASSRQFLEILIQNWVIAMAPYIRFTILFLLTTDNRASCPTDFC